MAHSVWPFSAPVTFLRQAERPSVMLPFCSDVSEIYACVNGAANLRRT